MSETISEKGKGMQFEYLEPMTIEEAVSLLSRYGGDATPIAGGTDLMLKMRTEVISPKVLVDIGSIRELDYIEYNNSGGLAIGALTTIRSLENSSDLQRTFPVISMAARQLGSVAIRNVATIGGNICNAAPSAETAPGLIALAATCKITGPGNERTVSLEDFLVGPGMTILREGELLKEIQVPPLDPHARGVYLKHSPRGTIDLALVGVAVVATLDSDDGIFQDIKIALGAVAPTPIRAHRAEETLKGNRITEALINETAEIAASEAHPISDVRASAEYRAEMVKVFTRRALKELIIK
ncbi:MAG: xanthine dehydrogenase family protein subunit M [Proteobacteria bacterium]|nr:xanthine dehydrogenase family protein subunit M [Pseudomonadota bacterium]